MSTSRFLKAGGCGVLLTLCFALLAAAPLHTAPATSSPRAAPNPLAYHAPETKSVDKSAARSGVAVASIVAVSAKAQGSGNTREAEQFFFKSANRERAEQGLPQLKWDETLATAARKHATLMADQEELSHRLPGEAALDVRIAQAGARFSSVGENVAIGPEPPEIHTGWMHSPGHRANILGTHFNALGVGVVERDGQLYAVEDFARAVENLSIEQQEKQVAAMLATRGLQVKQAIDDLEAARKICAGGSDAARGVGPAHGGMEILRYETPDLSSLPAQLDRSLRNSHYRQATVGACQGGVSENGIPRFRGVVLLFSQV